MFIDTEGRKGRAEGLKRISFASHISVRSGIPMGKARPGVPKGVVGVPTLTEGVVG